MSALRLPSNPAIAEDAVALVCDRMLAAAIGKHWRQRAPEAVTAFWMKEVRAALQAAFPVAAQQPTQESGGALWRCFHCDEAFADQESAAEHFGTRIRHDPACLIDPTEFRRLQDKETDYAEEDAAVHRAMRRMETEHRLALDREEVKGYERGLRDSRRCPCAAAPSASDAEVVAHIAMLRSLRMMYDEGVMDAEDHPGTVAALDAAILALTQQPKAVTTGGWVNVADGLPEIDEPVWAAFANGGCGLFVRAEADEGWAWCNTYGNVDAVKGKWIAEEAEFDDDYQPTRWHRLPSLVFEVAEVPAHG